MSAPIIVTAMLGASDFAWADALRRAHYPPERNQVPAHITLFHHLPPSAADELREQLKVEARTRAPVAQLSGLRHLGEGVAYQVDSPGLEAIREGLARSRGRDAAAGRSLYGPHRSDLTALHREKNRPAAMALTFVSTCTGVSRFVPVPSPTWPTLFTPQAHTTPDAVSTRLCESPAATAPVTAKSARGTWRHLEHL